MHGIFIRYYNTMQPLAERVRPTHLDNYIGQEQIIGKNTALRKAIEQNLLPSIILWGPQVLVKQL